MSRTVTIDAIPEQKPTKRAWNFIDRTGHRFGKLTALYVVKRSRPKAVYWCCRCDCGKETVVFVGHLTHNHTTSCGCTWFQRTSDANATHRESKAREYNSWVKIKGRCYTKSNKCWPDYGGRGITVCKRWRNSYTDFLADMGRCPAGMSIERKNNSGNYEPSNCVWGTPYMQSNNRRSNIRIAINGVIKNATQWARDYGICIGTVYSRLKHGWGKVESIITPARIGNYARGKRHH